MALRGGPAVLVSWVGQTDLDASQGLEAAGTGPLGQTVADRAFDRIVLLSNYKPRPSREFARWLGQRTAAAIDLTQVALSSPMHFGEIYQAVTERVRLVLDETGPDARLSFLLSPGTSAMAAVWIIVAKTRYAATLLQSSRERGVEQAQVPFDIAAEYVPVVLKRPDETLRRLSAGEAEPVPGFEAIVHKSEPMRRVVSQARQVAPRSVPVLIEGESGTGKELFAQAIHAASPRAGGPFVAVNCGAVVRELAESEFFGHRRGAFTGATRDRAGHFQRASEGTLFLDEVGELPLDMQVKLLRALQTGRVTPIGGSDEVDVDVRIIAATNRRLSEEVGAGTFREDLFYRLAVAILHLPALRERSGDVGLLVDSLLARINEESGAEPGWTEKKLSVKARNLLLRHPWPGNVRELQNTLLRAAVWTPDATIDEAAARAALLSVRRSPGDGDGILNRPISNGIELHEVMSEVARHYIERALGETGGNLTRAAELLGFSNYQTLKAWARKHGATA